MPLEPEAETIVRNRSDASDLLLASIAVSLRRIADAIEGSPERLGLVDGVMSAIEQGILSADARRS